MNVGMMKLWTRAVLVATVAVLVLSGGCGGGCCCSVTPDTDPVAYQIIGIDMVPDQVAGQPDLALIVNAGSSNGSGEIAQTIYQSCSETVPLQYIVLVKAGTGLGSKHYMMSGNPANVTIDESTGLVTIKGGGNCATGNYILFNRVDAQLNNKSAVSNSVRVNLTLTN